MIFFPHRLLLFWPKEAGPFQSQCTATEFTDLPFIMNVTYLITIITEKRNTACRIVIDHNDINKS